MIWTSSGKDALDQQALREKQRAENFPVALRVLPKRLRADLVAVYEAPDDAIAARFTLMLGMLGNVRTKTLKAFPEDAYREIINSLD